MKFHKKPIIVEAEQFVHPATAPMGVYVGENGECWVVTAHGHKTPVVPGDWIIREPDGEHYYPCKPDIFSATYEPLVEEDGPPKTDWRIGLSVKPKDRSSAFHYEDCHIVDVHPSGYGNIFDNDGVLRIKTKMGAVYLVPASAWMTR